MKFVIQLRIEILNSEFWILNSKFKIHLQMQMQIQIQIQIQIQSK